MSTCINKSAFTPVDNANISAVEVSHSVSEKPGKSGLKIVLQFVIGMALSLVAIDQAVAFAEPHINEPRRFYHARVDTLAVALEDLPEPDKVDALLVGTSVVERGLDAKTLGAELDLELPVNVSTPGGQIPVASQWLEQKVLTEVDPDLIVWGVTSIDFNENRLEPTIDSSDEARGTKPGFIGEADRLLWEVSSVSRLRSRLQLFRFTDELRTGEPTSILNQNPLSPLQNSLANRGEKNPSVVERVTREVVNDYETSPNYVNIMADTLSDLRSQGRNVVVVLMPVESTYVEVHPNGAADYADFRSIVTERVASLDVPLLDYSFALDDGDFADFTHLNVEGGTKLTNRLADDLAELGF